MKLRYLLPFLLFGCSALEAATSPLLVVLIMVKNEEEAIVPTLESFLATELAVGKEDPQDVAYLVYDTGSTDTTVARAEGFFKQYGIEQYHVISEEHPTPFHYANGRNRALELARQQYPSSRFILFPDAEWYMDDFDKLRCFCEEEARRADQGAELPSHYMITLVSPSGTIMPQARLFQTDDDIYFEGKKHEVPNKLTSTWVPRSIFMEYRTSRYGQEKSRNRWYTDRNDFMKELEKNPTDSRSTFYLGRTEQWLGHNHIAYVYLKKRVALPTFPEEDFSAMYNLALVTESLSYEDPDTYSWEEALGYYLKAYAMRPHRAEPLIRLAEHYIHEKNYETAYLFAKRAVELPEPDIAQELLPLDKEDYTFYRWDALSRCAWYVKEYDSGEFATNQAIEAHPNDTYLYGNLALYWDRK